MHPKRLATLLFLLVAAMSQPRAAGAPAPGAFDLHRMGWLPSDVYDVGEGLPDPTVNAVAVLPTGQAWFGTMRGLARQSGPRLLPESGPGGVLDVAILDLAASATGDLFVATDGNGVWRLRNGTWQSLGKPFGPARVQRLHVNGAAGRQRVFALGRGIAELTGDRWRTLPLPDAVKAGEQFDIALEPARDGGVETVWIASYGPGLYRCRGFQACEAVPVQGPGPRTNEIRSLQLQRLGDGTHALWVAMQGGGVARLARGAWTRWHTGNSGLPSDFVSSLRLLPSPTGTELWAGTRSGLAILRGDDTWAPPDPRVPLLRERIRSLVTAKTAQGVPLVWIGADGGAVRTPLRGPWHLISTLGKQGNGVWGLLVERGADGSEQLWLGSDGAGLAHHAGDNIRVFTRKDGLPSDTVRSVVRMPERDGGSAIWVGTWGGHLARLQGDRFTTIPTPWPKRDDEAASIVLAEPDNVWVSTRQQGLGHWDGREWHWLPPGPTAPDRVYSALRSGRDLWFSSSDQGLLRLRDGQWRKFQTDIGLPEDALYDMRLIRDGDAHVLWIGSHRNGVLRVDIRDPDRPVLVRTPVLPALPVSYVYGVVRDGNGDMMVCTDYGVFSWRRERDRYRATAYHREDGLPHDECNANAMQVDGAGRVWIGTVGGAAVYTPPARVARRASPLVLTALRVDGKPVHPVEVLRLPHATSTLELGYDLLTGEKEDDNRYRISLSDGETDTTGWLSSNAHRYARLPADTRRVRIEARDAFGIAATPIDLRIEVPQLWWRTPGARALMVLAVLGVFWAILRLRYRQLRQREAQLRDMVRERTAELQKREAQLRTANDDLRRLSYTDPLTGLGNRRRLFDTLEMLWRDAARKRESLGLLLIDLDHFKRFNDTHGHLAGDNRLQQVARLVQSLLPAGASASRYGGEELCVLLPGHDDRAAASVAERMRHAIAVLPADTALPEIDNIAVTGSIGVAACIPGLDQRPDILIARADRALYMAKAAGRNRVELAPPP